MAAAISSAGSAVRAGGVADGGPVEDHQRDGDQSKDPGQEAEESGHWRNGGGGRASLPPRPWPDHTATSVRRDCARNNPSHLCLWFYATSPGHAVAVCFAAGGCFPPADRTVGCRATGAHQTAALLGARLRGGGVGLAPATGAEAAHTSGAGGGHVERGGVGVTEWRTGAAVRRACVRGRG